jgi:hypothetical protein
MRRIFEAVLLAALAVVWSIAPVAAGSSGAPDAVVEFDAGVVCDFAVRLEDWSNVRTSTFVDEDGITRTVVTGSSTTRVTAIESGGFVTLQQASRVVLWEPGDGTWRVHSTGRTLFYFFDGDAGPADGGHGLFQVSGQVIETLDLASNVVTSFQHRGHVRDICAALS